MAADLLGLLVVLAGREQQDDGGRRLGRGGHRGLGLGVHGRARLDESARQTASGMVRRRGASVGSASAASHVADHRAAVAAVGHDQDPHPRLEAGQLGLDLVVEELAVVQDPGLVLVVGLVAVRVDEVAAVAGVGDEQPVAGLEELGVLAQHRDDLLRGRVGRQEGAGLEARLRRPRHRTASASFSHP